MSGRNPPSSPPSPPPDGKEAPAAPLPGSAPSPDPAPAPDSVPAPVHTPEKKQKTGLITRFRNYFLTGILVTAPAAITFYIAYLMISFIDEKVAMFIPEQYNPETYLPYGVPGLGVLILIVLLVLVGMFAAGFIGRALLRLWDGILNATPVVSSVYNVFKQIFETLFANRSQAFRQVALVEFPRPGAWALCFVTNPAPKEVDAAAQDETVGVYVPTVPNPTSGYFLFFPKKDVKLLSMPVENAWKILISAGVVVPEQGKKSASKKK